MASNGSVLFGGFAPWAVFTGKPNGRAAILGSPKRLKHAQLGAYEKGGDSDHWRDNVLIRLNPGPGKFSAFGKKNLRSRSFQGPLG